MNVEQFAGWIPVHIDWHSPRPLHWCFLGTRRFTEPFFDQTVALALRHPFSQFLGQQTALDALIDWRASAPVPAGFIFHMSRCGSTLVTQMLAALPRCIVISEAQPVDAILRANRHDPLVVEDPRIVWLRGLMGALGQRRNPDERHVFVKFDCWHTRYLPLIRRAFPSVPWVFLHRNPVEVMVSHLKIPGLQMVPSRVKPAFFDMDAETPRQVGREEYIARVLGSICRHAAAGLECGGGIFVDYARLPGAVEDELAKHFHLDLSAAERDLMRQAALPDAKNPFFLFQQDREAKQAAATALVREMASRWVQPL